MKSQPPFRFQHLVYDRFLSERDIILQAPPGAGKTRAALGPGIEGFNRKKPDAYPPRILYAAPMRTLTRGFWHTYTKTAQTKGWERDWHPYIQTGEQPDDPQLEHRLIFATVDQILASFLTLPYGLPASRDNINAGAIVGSYLIFDEFHLYPQQQMMLSVLAMLKMLKGISRFMLMSATFSTRFLHAIAQELGAEMIADAPGESDLFADVDPIRTQRRTWHAQDGALTAEAVKRHRDQRTLCICNTIDRAQALYDDVRAALPGVECRLLHGRFYRDDRRKTEDYLLDAFEDSASETILIATQVAEVGLDISSKVLLTECAPAASLIQRAGRCARRENQTGQVHVFQPPPNDKGIISYAPYTDEDKEDICHKTWAALCSSDFNEQVLRFVDEQRLIDLAHGEADERFVEGLGRKINNRIDDITRCLSNREDNYLTSFIRTQSSIPLYVHSDPNTDDIFVTAPWLYESFSLSRGQLFHAFDTWLQEGIEAECYLYGCRAEPQDKLEAEDSLVQPRYAWHKLHEPGEVFDQRYRWFAAHPEIVSYSKYTGLQLQPSLEGVSAETSRKIEKPTRPREPFVADRYHEHITGLFRAYTQLYVQGDKLYQPLKDEFLYPLHRLCQRAGKDPATGEQMLRLAIALHDIGKLNRPWQAWAQAWQRHYAANGYDLTVQPNDLPIAHTDYDSRDPAQRELYKHFRHAPRGMHAVESAEACFAALREAAENDPFWVAVTTCAIMRHHTPDAHECGPFHMASGVQEAMLESLRLCGFESKAERWIDSSIKQRFDGGSVHLSKCIEYIHPNYEGWYAALMYYLFVRILRLADQRSGDYWRRYR